MADHAWMTIVQVGKAPDTETVEQCRVCELVRHTYCYATQANQQTTMRHFKAGILVGTRECKR